MYGKSLENKKCTLGSKVCTNFTFSEYQEAHLGFGRFGLPDNTCKVSEGYVNGKISANAMKIARKLHNTKISTPDEFSICDLKHHVIVTID